MSVVPVGYRILVKRDSKEEVSAGGIVLSRQSVERDYAASTRGVVVARGANAFEDDDEARDRAVVGVTILFRKYAGITIDSKDDTLILINDKDVVGILE